MSLEREKCGDLLSSEDEWYPTKGTVVTHRLDESSVGVIVGDVTDDEVDVLWSILPKSESYTIAKVIRRITKSSSFVSLEKSNIRYDSVEGVFKSTVTVNKPIHYITTSFTVDYEDKKDH